MATPRTGRRMLCQLPTTDTRLEITATSAPWIETPSDHLLIVFWMSWLMLLRTLFTLNHIPMGRWSVGFMIWFCWLFCCFLVRIITTVVFQSQGDMSQSLSRKLSQKKCQDLKVDQVGILSENRKKSSSLGIVDKGTLGQLHMWCLWMADDNQTISLHHERLLNHSKIISTNRNVICTRSC